MSIAAMKQALEALESYHGYIAPLNTIFGGPKVPAEQSTSWKVEKAITTLRQAIAEAEKPAAPTVKDSLTTADESYAWMSLGGTIWRHKTSEDDVPLYTRPQPAAWVGLTDEEIEKTLGFGGFTADSTKVTLIHLSRAIEAKLKEKNT